MPRKFGCFMLKTYFDTNQYSSKIEESDLYIKEGETSGIVTNQHVTIVYGIGGDPSEEDILKTMKELSNIEIDLISFKGLTLFENEDFDVLKLDVVPDKNLLKLREIVKSNYDCSGDTYSDYHPHITIAYLKPGTGKKYMDKAQSGTSKLGAIIYSSAQEDVKYKFNLSYGK